jgi:ABC-2 type transport system permease protein
MAGNDAFQLVSERGWRRGLGNMLRSELGHWWTTRMWWVQCLIWVGMIGFMLGAILFSSPNSPPSEEVAMFFSIFAGLFPSVGVVIIMQGAVVAEKREGTAAWVLSKPVTRASFLLSKVIANSLGVVATMVLLPAAVAYLLYAIASGNPWHIPGFLAALAVIFVVNFFFLSLTLMLGTFFRGRGAVIGIALGLLFLQQYIVQLLPGLRFVLPWNLIIPMGQMDAMVPCLILRCAKLPYLTLIVVAVESIVFITIGLWRFSREEF